MRIVSLVPSATEIVCLLGAGEELVGRSHECDYPVEVVAGVPILTSAEMRGTDPAEIDAAVRKQLESGESLYGLDVEALRRAKPDLILTQDLCAVCSIDLATVRRIAAGLEPKPAILSLNPESIEDVLDDVLRVGEAIGREREATQAVVRLRGRMHAAMDYVPAFEEGPNVAFLEWTDPLYIGGHWVPQIIERAGGRCPLNPTVPVEGSGAAIGPQQAARKAGKSIRVPTEVLAASRPDRLVISPCGVGLAQVREMVKRLEGQAWFEGLPAVQRARGEAAAGSLAGARNACSCVALVDGNQMFSRPGPRLIDALEWMVGWLQNRPEVMPRGFPWEGWS